MVTAKNVIWAESAKKDLQQIYQRIASKSIERAKETIQTILKKTATLSANYLQGTSEPLLSKEKDPYKFVMAGFYKVVYSIVEDTVVIETLYHQRQDPMV